MSREALLNEMLSLVPRHLHDLSGSILYSGYDAFTRPSSIYLMAINPGGSPEEITQTVSEHTRGMLLNQPANYSAYLAESWKGRPPGEENVQRRIRRLLEGGLGLDPRSVPTTNLVFQRTRKASEIPSERYEECWPLHEAMIKRVGARVIVCLGEFAERTRQVAHADEVVEDNRDPERTWISRMPDGRVVVRGVHPVRSSNAAWDRNESLISRALRAAAM